MLRHPYRWLHRDTTQTMNTLIAYGDVIQAALLWIAQLFS